MNIIWRKAKDGFPQNSAKEILKDKKEIHTQTPNSGISDLLIRTNDAAILMILLHKFVQRFY